MKMDEKVQARELYLYAGKSQTEIASILRVDRKTVYNWIQTGNWEEMKISRHQAPAVVMQDVYNHIDEINKKIGARDPGNRVPTLEEVEMLRKLVYISKALDKGNVGLYIQAYEQLINMMMEKDVPLAQTTSLYADRMIKSLLPDKHFYKEKPDVKEITTYQENTAQYNTPK